MIPGRPAVLLLAALLCGCSGGPSIPKPTPPTAPTSPAPAGPTSFDLSTDSGVQSAYREATGSKDNIYIRRSEQLPEIAVVNDRIPDLGDRLLGVFINKRWYPAGTELEPALTSLGWKAADADARVAIVRKWVEGSAIYGAVISKPAELPPKPRSPSPAIKPAVFTPTGDGGVRADFWAITGWNFAGEPMYQHHTLTFDGDGKRVQ